MASRKGQATDTAAGLQASAINLRRCQRIALLFGGWGGEYDLSCASAAAVLESLDPDRYEIVPVHLSQGGQWVIGDAELAAAVAGRGGRALAQALEPDPGATLAASFRTATDLLRGIDVVFPAMHGAYGEDGTLQNVLDALGVPYVGSGVYASATGMNKVATKRLAATQGTPVAASVMLRPGSDALTDAQQARLGLPVFVKPVRSGSGLGVTQVEYWTELGAAIASARVHDTLVLIEEAVGGWHVQVGVLEHPDGRLEVGPPLEIQRSGSSWAKGPARIPAVTVAQLERFALDSFRTLGCAGLLRADFVLRGGSSPVLLEVTTRPGLTPDSSFPLIWQAAGRSFAELLDVLVRQAGRRLVVPRQRSRVISRRG